MKEGLEFKNVEELSRILQAYYDVSYNRSYDSAVVTIKTKRGLQDVFIGESDFSDKKFQASIEELNFEFDTLSELLTALERPLMFFENKNIIEIKEEVQIGNAILEKGDKIEILKESSSVILDHNSALLLINALSEFKKTKNYRENWSFEEWEFVYNLVMKAI